MRKILENVTYERFTFIKSKFLSYLTSQADHAGGSFTCMGK